MRTGGWGAYSSPRNSFMPAFLTMAAYLHIIGKVVGGERMHCQWGAQQQKR